MAVRIAHATDIHWTLKPALRRLASKRLLQQVNQVIGRRAKHFTRDVQDSLMDHLVDLAPDGLFITGDLTTTALEEEFVLARRCLEPVLSAMPTLIIPGNHDVYTRKSQSTHRMFKTFGPWMGLDSAAAPLARLDVGDVTLLGLDPTRPHPVLSSGRVPQPQLDRLVDQLNSLADRAVVLGLHYPILDRRGDLYNGLNHGLLNAAGLQGALTSASHLPVAILHGHEHHGFTVDLDCGGRTVPIYNSGSSGYANLPVKRRAAAMCVYTVEDGALVDVERYLHTAEGFKPEPGGAYATGR
ncbi:MAG: 3',5'-cyclic AMP phosphodiesterase CpdA [Myxococcota bacterium]|jgi:3',5'-cyclic AMP phosphodiesterase CpdA